MEFKSEELNGAIESPATTITMSSAYQIDKEIIKSNLRSLVHSKENRLVKNYDYGNLQILLKNEGISTLISILECIKNQMIDESKGDDKTKVFISNYFGIVITALHGLSYLDNNKLTKDMVLSTLTGIISRNFIL